MNTQTCTKCLEVKSLSQFNRRGDAHQRICKSCTSIAGKERYAKHGRNRITTNEIVNKENVPALSEIVVSIEAKLREKAKHYSNDPLEADDLYSAMVENILTKSDPADSAARILGRADWVAHEHIQRTRTYNYRVEASEDESAVFAGSLSTEDELVERETSTSMRNIIAQLPTDYQQVVSFLAVGLTQREIADKLEISEQAVSQKVKLIGSQMINLGLSFA